MARTRLFFRLGNNAPFGDRQDFEDAMRGFIATTPDPVNPDRWAFLKHEAPPTVNPSLWRQAQINVANGDPPRRKTRYSDR
jgi:alkyl sulfatase BDS1-like metallo-beta-lactamase superfamily hydrolase